jgi:hypothetical protein
MQQALTRGLIGLRRQLVALLVLVRHRLVRSTG